MKVVQKLGKLFACLGLAIFLNGYSCQDVVLQAYSAVEMFDNEKLIVQKYHPYYPQTCDEYFQYFPHKTSGYILKNEDDRTTLCESWSDQALSINGSILNPSTANDLLNLIGFESKYFELVYRASRDGFRGSDYHSKVDCKSNTLHVIKTTDETIFGGYTTTKSSKVDEWVRDDAAFLYTLRNPANNPLKLLVKSDKKHEAIRNKHDHLTRFGWNDLIVKDSSNENVNSYVTTGQRYEGPNGLSGDDAGVYITGGDSRHFRTVEIEVFMEKASSQASEFSSLILDASMKEELLALCGFETRRLELIYRASRDGFGASDYHSKVDCKSNTLHVIKTTDETIFGGYTTTTSSKVDDYMRDDAAFLYTLRNLVNRPLKLPVKSNEKHKAIKNKHDYLSNFGDDDLRVKDMSNENVNSYVDIDKYEGPDGLSGSSAGVFITGGINQNFRTVEIEVFVVH